MIAVLGAGAMGAALATHLARSGAGTVVLATAYDDAVVKAWRGRLPHPALGIMLPRDVAVRDWGDWDESLAAAEAVFVAVSSPGLHGVVSAAAEHAAPDAIWVLVTKGWQPATLLAPSEVAAAVLGPDRATVTLAGPGIAAEIVSGSPTALLCASHDRQARHQVAQMLTSPSMLIVTTSDVTGAETASAYKNVVAIAVGIAEGLSDRFIESAVVRAFANARGAMFAQGMLDMVHLVEARGGHSSTVLGLAGAGDLYVTCVGGRNGRFGRLLGSGSRPEQALRSIGSTVEGIANTTAALGLAERYSIDLPTARAVDLALGGGLADEHALEQVRQLFTTSLRQAAHHPR
ncbi:MAG TPA: NAD(P)H-dependent glycerol-3-phosphate dehydrogenase [Micromonosporaceae bacterium]